MKVVIIGGGAGGLSTASNIRKYDEDIEITVITRDTNIAYSPCAIPYVLSGDVECFDDIIMHKPKDYLDKNIKILTETEVCAVNHDKKILKYSSIKEDENIDDEITYDKLVIATGGSPFVPPMEGTNLDGVFKIRTINDGREILKWAEKSNSAIVAGAGLIGLEIAYGLKKMGLEVTVSEMLPQIVPRSLDPGMAKIIQSYMEDKGINVVLGKPIEKIGGETKVESAVFGDEVIPTDMIILATGVRPEVNLAKMIGCDLGRWAIKVNEYMQTSVPDVYAVGDCVEAYDAFTGLHAQSPLGSTAVRQAKVAAKTIVGIKSKFNPILNAMVSKIGKLEFGAVGLTRAAAMQNKMNVVTGKKRALTKARYYPGAKPIDVKMICDIDGKILGCQIVAEERVAERIDTMALAIAKELTCDELANMEFSYAPPVSMVIDPIILAAEDAQENLNKLTN